MLPDSSGLPLGGGLVLGLAAYAAASLFVTGQVIGERMIERSDWAEQCRALVRADIEAQQPAVPPVPEVDCEKLTGGFGGLFGVDMRAICKMPGVGDAFDAPRRLREAEAARISRAVAGAASRCDCAASLTLEEERIVFALHAGSVRLITPQPVKALEARLTRALHAPQCRR